MKFNQARRTSMMKLRAAAIRTRGSSLKSTTPQGTPLSTLYEYNPHVPVALQETHPLLKILDDEAREEDRQWRLTKQFQPKPFMTPNIFLPAYLEVSYWSCTGCFVRLPHVKKDGRMEIPSPFPPEVHARAGMFYARFGRRVELQKHGFRGYRHFQAADGR
jgi:hypothetical protein